MSATHNAAAHEVVLPIPPPIPESKFRKERRAFFTLLPSLLTTHHDQYVAIHEGRVVEVGDNLVEVAERAYDKYGYIPIYVGLVTDKPITPVRLPSVRKVTKEMVP